MNDIRNELHEKQFTESLQKQYERFRLIGMSIGSKAVCGVILEKANKYDGQNADDIIDDIKKFCQTSLDLPEYIGEKE